MRVICFETGLEKQTILDGFAFFAKAGKVEYDASVQVVWVKNMLKYQGTESPQVRKRIIADIKAVPECAIKEKFVGIHRVLIGYADGGETLHSISSLSLVESSEVEGGGAGEGTNDVSEISIPATPRQAMADARIQVYKSVSGCFPAQRDYGVIIDTIQFLRGQHGDRLEEYLKPYWIAWSTRRTKDNKPYNPASLVWLCEWAMQGDIPKANGHEPRVNKTVKDVIRKVAQHATR